MILLVSIGYASLREVRVGRQEIFDALFQRFGDQGLRMDPLEVASEAARLLGEQYGGETEHWLHMLQRAALLEVPEQRSPSVGGGLFRLLDWIDEYERGIHAIDAGLTTALVEHPAERVWVELTLRDGKRPRS